MSEVLHKQQSVAQDRGDTSHPLFCAQAALLSQRFLHFFWSGDIVTCAKFLDPNVCLVESNMQRSFVGKDNVSRFLSEQRLRRTPDYRGHDEEYDVQPVTNDVCTVSARYHAPAGPTSAGDASRSNVFGSFFWMLGENGLPLLKLCNFSRQSDRELSEARREPNATETGSSTVEHRVALQAHDTSGTTHWVYPHNVIYIAAAHQYTDVHCRDRLIHLRASFTQVLEQLDGVVVRIHRSYAVNPSYISHMEGEELHLINGAVLPIPVKRVRQVRELLAQHADKLGDRT